MAVEMGVCASGTKLRAVRVAWAWAGLEHKAGEEIKQSTDVGGCSPLDIPLPGAQAYSVLPRILRKDL